MRQHHPSPRHHASGSPVNDNGAESIAELHAMKRLCKADDIAPLTSFLPSPDAGWIPGQVINVDG